MRYSHIIWDWNGTLLDDVSWSIESMNKMLSARNKETIRDLADYHNVFCFPVSEYYKNLGFDFEEESFPVLAQEYINIYHGGGSQQLTLYKNTNSVLKHINDTGSIQIILSAAAQESLYQQLLPFKISHYFSDVLGISNIYAESKIEIGKKYINDTEIKKAVLIGDTVHDYEVSKALEIDCLLIACGHQSMNTLKLCNATVLNDITEVLAHII